MINVVLKPKKEIQVSLKPEQGIQIEATKKYLFDPAIAQEYVDASAENAEIAINKAAETQQIFDNTVLFTDNVKSDLVSYTDNAKNDIANIVSQGEENVQEYVDNSKQEIQEIARTAAEDAVQDAANEATRIATEQTNIYVVNTIEPKLQEYVSNAEADASNASESAGHASESASDASHYAEDARIWAEGEQAEVQELGGELSSKMWALRAGNSATSASQSATQAKTSETNAKSYADSINPDRFLNKKMITNCITEIPQDIKLELSNGTLTLKAGSKVYIANGKNADGSMKFDEVVIKNDLARTTFSANTTTMVFYNTAGNIQQVSVRGVFSGSGEIPANGIHYKTDTNLFYINGVQAALSLPMFVAKTDSNGVITSIDQVFNGFGYIGSTVFALPSVKVLIPNGRNADGTLKNLEIINSKVKTGLVVNGNRTLVLTPSAVAGYADTIYHTESNINTNAAGVYQDCCHCGKVVVEKGVITSFTPKLPFRAVDHNDLPTITYWD